MSLFQKIKQNVSNEITKINKLSRDEKAWYIWEYAATMMEYIYGI